MKFYKQLLFVSFFLSAFLVNAQNREVQIKVNKLTDNIYVLVGQGGNIGLFVGEDGALSSIYQNESGEAVENSFNGKNINDIFMINDKGELIVISTKGTPRYFTPHQVGSKSTIS